MKFLFCLLLVACGTGGLLTPQDKSNLVKFDVQDKACIAAYAPDVTKMDACRADAKARFEAAEAAALDAGTDAGDAQ